MLKVGLVVGAVGENWLGGVNYFKSLVTALTSYPDGVVEPIVVMGNKAPAAVAAAFTGCKVIRTSLCDRRSLLRYADKSLSSLCGRNLLFQALVRKHGFKVMSHVNQLRLDRAVATIGWVPDLQHAFLPEFFSSHEISARNLEFGRALKECDLVLVSSNSAKHDLLRHFGRSPAKVAVLQFVPDMPLENLQVPLAKLEVMYEFNEPYFFLPNQFWIHKNHRVVIRALAELKRQGHSTPLILLTGNQRDHRFPGHFDALMDEVKTLGIEDRFRVLGVVPYAHLLSLMWHSIAVVNPSLFEGWSTTVEEAKAMNKIVVLSDIPVHREQAPERSMYFEPHDFQALAANLMAATAQSNTNAMNLEELHEKCEVKRKQFARNYQHLVGEALRGRRPSL